MKKTFLFVVAALSAMVASAQTLPEDVIRLTPAGVTPVIDAGLNDVKQNNLVIAGDSVNGYFAYFAAEDDEHGLELWVTDGTVEGTHLVKDINPGDEGSGVAYITRFNNKVVFAANDGENGKEPWISDGTEEGTYMIADVHETSSSYPQGFCQVDEDVFVFAANNLDTKEYAQVIGKNELWLFVSDGTEEGTECIYELDIRYPGKFDVDAHNGPFIRVGRQVFFKADSKDLKYGEELWVTNGTRKGTHLVKDINTEYADAENPDAGTADNALNFFINFYNEKLYFNAFSDNHGHEPWATDGTEAGTYEIYNAGTYETTVLARDGSVRDCDGQQCYPTLALGKVFNRGNVSVNTYGNELYATNCEKGDYHLIYDAQTKTINQDGKCSGFPDVLCEFDGCLWYETQTGTYADGGVEIEMHRYDGNSVTLPFGDFNPTGHGCLNKAYVVSGDCFYFSAAEQGPNLMKVYRIDNKDQKTPTLVANLSGSWEIDDQIHTFRNCGGTMLFCSAMTNAIYACTYKKPGYNKSIDNQQLEIEYRTRQQIKDGVDPHWRPESALRTTKEESPKAVKLWHNGQLLILSNGRIVNVLGQQLNK